MSKVFTENMPIVKEDKNMRKNLSNYKSIKSKPYSENPYKYFYLFKNRVAFSAIKFEEWANNC